MENDVTIVGAGVAGINAANHLINKGFSVTLIEQRDTPGGRINSFKDLKSGDVIDNGQHLLMGAYTEFLSLLDNLGTSKFLRFIENTDLRIFSKEQLFHLKANSTGKISFANSLIKLNGISVTDKVKIFYIFSMLQFQDPDNFININTLTYLKKFHQSEFLIKLFWEPLILATMNNKPENSPASILITVMKKAFLSDKKSSQMIFATKGLSELIEPILNKVNKNGIFLPRTKLSELVLNNNKIEFLRTANEEIIKSKYYILAIQPNEVIKYYPIPKSKLVENLKKFQYSPIISIYLWFDTGTIDFDFAAFIESETQWIFNRRNLVEHSDAIYKNHFTLLISSADNLIDKSNSEILAETMNDLITRFPEYKNYELKHYRIIKEKFATLKITPETELLRPKNITEISNLFLAGDWTDTKLPATIESAAISGKNSIKYILNI